ncbi:hypothetical protein IV203_002785 [Nitzschia inconspicua]|uniref:Rubisco accumulation factor 1 C-terminal domain-containing protein n=1 Tax=Nitzschia inconspicua TaxID=303405 RepID=A0A9K3L280_9STRA|nr:hypothetical protein IV203_002785 [Nitzschia inconspicua]
MMNLCFASLLAFSPASTVAWVSSTTKSLSHPRKSASLQNKFRPQPLASTPTMSTGSLHGQNSCFLPLKQLDQDYYAPRIVQIAGAYPGLTKEEFFAVKSEPSPELGQWTYDFSDPDGPQLGTVAIEGSNVVASCEDPVVIIAEHPSLAVPLPEVIKDPVDLIVLVDRAANRFAERKFLVLSISGGNELKIGAFPSKQDLPEGCEILGQVVLCQIPWLPSMKPTKSGFMEVDEYF